MKSDSSAFPVPSAPEFESRPPHSDGMPILFWFAGKALQGLLAGDTEGGWQPQDVVLQAYRLAELMLAEGNRRLS